jgi:hypothetical protein
MGPAAPYSQAGRRSRSFGLMETGVSNTALDAMRLKPACNAAGARWEHTQYSDARALLLLMAATAASVPNCDARGKAVVSISSTSEPHAL